MFLHAHTDPSGHSGSCWRLVVHEQPKVIYMPHVITTPTSTEVNCTRCLPVSHFAPLFWGCQTLMVEIGIRSHGFCISTMTLDRYLFYVRGADCTTYLQLTKQIHIETPLTRHLGWRPADIQLFNPAHAEMMESAKKIAHISVHCMFSKASFLFELTRNFVWVNLRMFYMKYRRWLFHHFTYEQTAGDQHWVAAAQPAQSSRALMSHSESLPPPKKRPSQRQTWVC